MKKKGRGQEVSTDFSVGPENNTPKDLLAEARRIK